MPVHAYGAIDYKEAAQVATISVPDFSLSTDRSRIDVRGTLRDLSDKNIDATVNLRKLSAIDINSMLPQANLASDLSGAIQLSGHASDLHSVMAFAAGTANLQAKVGGDLTQSQPAWWIQANLSKVDLRKLLKPQQTAKLPAGEINATVNARGAGTSLADANAGLDGRITGLAIGTLRLGDLSINARIARQVANLKTLLSGPDGRAQINGRIDIAKVPAYNLTLGIEHLRPANMLRNASDSTRRPQSHRRHRRIRLSAALDARAGAGPMAPFQTRPGTHR